MKTLQQVAALSDTEIASMYGIEKNEARQTIELLISLAPSEPTGEPTFGCLFHQDIC